MKFDNGGSTGNNSKSYSRESAKVNDKAQDADSGSNKAQRSHSFRGQHRFPDLARKQVWREKIEAMPEADVFLLRADGSMEQVAFGEGDGHSDTAGLDAADRTGREQSPSLPWFVNAGLKTIAAEPDFTPEAQLMLVRPRERQELVFSLPIVVDEDGEISDKLLYCAPDGRVRQRRACFVEVTENKLMSRYLIIVEGGGRSKPPRLMVVNKPAINDTVRLLLQENGKTSSDRLDI